MNKQKFKYYWSYIANLPSILYFNFYYLPFNQAVRLPFRLHKVSLINMSGKVVLDMPDHMIKRGMISLGVRMCTIFPNNGLKWDNHGGTIIFKGNCSIGSDSYLSFGKNTTVEFGDDFLSTASLKIVSYRGIVFGKSTRLGWQSLVMDTNLHPIYDMNKKKFKRASSPIIIGDYNWFGTQCKIMHGVNTPERCIFGMNTLVTKGCEMKSYCVMGGSPVRILSEDVMRIIGQDVEEE